VAKTPPVVDLNALGKPPGLPAISVAKGQALAEAAAVCLEHQHHKSGKTMKVAGMRIAEYRLTWPSVTRQMRMTHNDLQEATADGACAIAISLARDLTGLSIIERSRKGTGFDYWLGKDAGTLFQNKSRLEVSGILKGDKTTIERRLRRKLTQTKRSDVSNLPAFVCVVEFGTPQAHLVKREP
jgi:hypothetical protein